MIVWAVTIAGIILLIFGRLPISFDRWIKGTRARLVGLALTIPVPTVFMIGFVLGATNAVTVQSVDTDQFRYFFGSIQLPVVLISLLLASAIAYWPQKRKSAPKVDSELAALYPVQSTPTLTVGQVALQLGLTEAQIQRLIDDSTLTLINANGKSEIERVSLDSFLLCREGVEHAKNGEIESALIDFDQAVALNPRNVRAYFLRGKANLGFGNFREAYSDFQYVYKSHRDYPQVEELLVRTRQALQTKAGKTKWAVKHNRPNVFLSDLTKGPLFILVVLIVAVIETVTSIPSINNLGDYNCRRYNDCLPAYATTTAQIKGTAVAFATETAGTQIAVFNTRDAAQFTFQAPTVHAAQTLYPMEMATATSFYAAVTESSIQLTNAANTTRTPIPGKLLIAANGNLYTADPNGNLFTEFNIDGQSPYITPSLKFYSATWTHSGKQIFVYTSEGIYLTNYNGSGTVKVRGQIINATPVLSPDEKSIAVINFPATDLDLIAVADAQDWEKARHLVSVSSDQRIYNPSWSPDGKALIYCLDAGNKSGVYFVNTNNSTAPRLITQSYRCPISWSPDGTRIAFTIFHNGGPNFWSGYGQLATMNADGTDVRVLFSDFNNPISINQPSWSPDGKHLAFVVEEPPSRMLYIVDEDGTNLRNITPDPKYNIYNAQVSWGP